MKDNYYFLDDKQVLRHFFKCCVEYFSGPKKNYGLRFFFENEEDRKKLIFLSNGLFYDNDLNVKMKNYLKNNGLVDGVSTEVPTIIIRDSNAFFDNLKDLIYSYSKSYCELNNTYITSKIQESIVKHIFLRAKSEDFGNINDFFRKQIEQTNYLLFKRFTVRQLIGKLPFLDNCEVYLTIGAAKIYDESPFEAVIEVGRNNDYVKLPLVRFGIFSRNGEKICSLGSIQNKELNERINVEENKKKINSSIKHNRNIEPKKVISMLIVISLLKGLGVSIFEFQGLNVLDYNFHEILGISNHEAFIKKYPDGKKPKEEDFKDDFEYSRAISEYYRLYLNNKRYYQREGQIIKTKTTEFFDLANRVLQHFDGKILYRPFDVDSNFMIRVDNLNSKDMPNLATQEISSMVSKLFTPSMYSFEDSYNYETGSFNVDILNELALNGDKDAIITLGLLYSYGLDGVEYDYYKAQKYFQLGEVMGDLRCAVSLLHFDEDYPIERDEDLKRSLRFEKRSCLIADLITRVALFRSTQITKGFDHEYLEELYKIQKEKGNILFAKFINSIIEDINKPDKDVDEIINSFRFGL